MLIIARVLSCTSALLLIATAYLHSTGTEGVRELLAANNITGFFGEALPVIWLFFSWHLVILATPLVWASITNPHWFFPASAFCSVIVIGDFFWVYSIAGWFPGTIILCCTIVSLITTAILLRVEKIHWVK